MSELGSGIIPARLVYPIHLLFIKSKSRVKFLPATVKCKARQRAVRKGHQRKWAARKWLSMPTLNVLMTPGMLHRAYSNAAGFAVL